jgi:methionine-rich copper-binding protein CopC
MKRIRGACSVLACLLSAAALAHTRLETSAPSNGAEVVAPAEIVLAFSEPVHVTAVSIRSGSSAHATGEIPQGPAETFSIPVTGKLAPGEYTVTWRAVSADTHIVSGDFSFVVADSEAAAEADAAEADAAEADAGAPAGEAAAAGQSESTAN